jgi:hypothetical protein
MYHVRRKTDVQAIAYTSGYAISPPSFNPDVHPIPVQSRRTAPSISSSEPPGVEARSHRSIIEPVPETSPVAQTSYSRQYSTTPPRSPIPGKLTFAATQALYEILHISQLSPTSQSTRPYCAQTRQHSSSRHSRQGTASRTTPPAGYPTRAAYPSPCGRGARSRTAPYSARRRVCPSSSAGRCCR